MQAVRTFRQRLTIDGHVIAEGDRGRLIRAGAPHFVVGHERAPDLAPLHAGTAVVDRDVSEANGLSHNLLLTGSRRAQLRRLLLLGRQRQRESNREKNHLAHASS